MNPDFKNEDEYEYDEDDETDFDYYLELDENKNVKFYLHDPVSVNIFRNVLESEHIDFFRRLLLNLDSFSSEGEKYNDTIRSDTFQYSYREGIFEIDVRLSNYYTCAASCDKEYIRELAEKIVNLYDLKK